MTNPTREHYDRFVRDPESRAFYQSARWRKVRAMKLAANPLCETCEQAGRAVPADVVHHLFPLRDNPEKALRLEYLVSLCHACHNAVETELERAGRVES